jgi:hypothetical protein
LKDSSRRVKCVQRSWHEEVSKCTENQESMCLRHGDSSGTQERERPPLEVGTRGLVKGQQTEKTKRLNKVGL